MPDAGAVRSNSMAPLASGTPCCTTVARWCTDGAKAPALAANARTALYMVQVIGLVQVIGALQATFTESMQTEVASGLGFLVSYCR